MWHINIQITGYCFGEKFITCPGENVLALRENLIHEWPSGRVRTVTKNIDVFRKKYPSQKVTKGNILFPFKINETS